MRLALHVLLALSSTGCAEELTEIVVVADTDLVVPAEIDRIVFTVDATEIDMTTHDASVDLRAGRPAVLGIVHEGGPLGPLTIRAEGRHDGTMVVTRRAVVSFERGQVRMLRMDLFSACRGVTCTRGLTCSSPDGACETEARGLVEWPGGASRLDADVPLPDGGDAAIPMDGSVPTDGPRDGATDAFVPDGDVGCTLADGGPCSELDVTAGDGHSCAIAPGDRIFCWGNNGTGELGDGTTTNRPMPVEVMGLPAGATRVSAGADHTCALLTDGSIACWGHGGDGRLGDGATSNRSTPLRVASLGGVATDVSAGELHTCAVVASRVRCWGANGSGQIATASGLERSPVDVPGVPAAAVQVSAGRGHTCAVQSGGEVHCWGDNNDGQVGAGAASSVEPPTLIDLMADAQEVTAGGTHTCALLVGGQVYCWGRGSDGQLGNGGTAQRPAPFRVPSFTATQVSAGASHTCALSPSGAFCWGTNGDGQLGNGLTLRSPSPSAVVGVTDFTFVEAGALHTCGRRGSGSLACWGGAALGDGSSSSTEPVTFATP